jgi:hypothetical protein
VSKFLHDVLMAKQVDSADVKTVEGLIDNRQNFAFEFPTWMCNAICCACCCRGSRQMNLFAKGKRKV